MPPKKLNRKSFPSSEICPGQDLSNSLLGIEQDVPGFSKRSSLRRVSAPLTRRTRKRSASQNEKRFISLAESRFCLRADATSDICWFRTKNALCLLEQRCRNAVVAERDPPGAQFHMCQMPYELGAARLCLGRTESGATAVHSKAAYDANDANTCGRIGARHSGAQYQCCSTLEPFQLCAGQNRKQCSITARQSVLLCPGHERLQCCSGGL